MLTPAMRAKKAKADKAAMKAAQSDSVVNVTEGAGATLPGPETLNYELALSALNQDKKALKEITKVSEKIDYKRKACGQYFPFLSEYLASGASYKNEVLVTIALWCLDIELIDEGMLFAELAIMQQQILPPNFKRTLPELMAEMITDWAERQYKQKASASPYIERVAELVFSNKWPVIQVIIFSKLYRQAALNAELAEDWGAAVMYYEKCIEANPDKHGVKTKHEKAKAILAKLTPET